MVVLQESPWYQEILQQDWKEGWKQGWKEGWKEGRYEERLSMTLMFLTRRVGNLSSEMAVQVQALSFEQLEALGEALLDFSELRDLRHWLVAVNRQTPPNATLYAHRP
jgi:predicted transposase YdaD